LKNNLLRDTPPKKIINFSKPRNFAADFRKPNILCPGYPQGIPRQVTGNSQRKDKFHFTIAAALPNYAQPRAKQRDRINRVF
jgi:hypothetical protein